MSMDSIERGLQEAINEFSFSGTLSSCGRMGHGHINDTFLVVYEDNGDSVPYTVQHMNKFVFKDPVNLMENLTGVTEFLKEKIIAAGGDPHRETLDFIMTKDHKPYYLDSFGEYWRAYRFVDHAHSLDVIESPEDFAESGRAFGQFQSLLSDYPVETLHEIIEGFHDTAARFEVFKNAVASDVCGRVSSARDEIAFYLEREPVAHALGDLLKEGKLPLRVTHNDTKSNNVLIDEATGKCLCVIDLDTVMPGLSVNDFGDSIRFGANTAAEDEQDITKVSCDLTLFDAFTRGFIQGCAGKLTREEIACLPLGAKVMTYECGMRFLTDYLQGDTYFKTAYPTHNLVRSRTQMALVADMEKKWDTLQEIVSKYL